MAASQNGDTLMMRLLINAGANLYQVNNAGTDALGCAVISGSKEAVEFLLDSGNRWNYSNGDLNDPVELAYSYGNQEILKVLHDRGLVRNRELTLDAISFSAGGMFTTHYQMATMAVSLADPRLGTGIVLGTAFNPSSQRMLFEGDDDIIYQYRLSSKVIYAGLSREFILGKPSGVERWSFVPSLSAGYRFYSRYEGTNDKPEDKFCIIPSAEIRWTMRRFNLGSGLTYLNTPFYKVIPVWFTLKASFTFNSGTKTVTGKKIRLYDYE
jgi:hypothetical protein